MLIGVATTASAEQSYEEAYANAPKIIINSTDEIPLPTYNVSDGLQAVYIIENGIQPRAICYNCGRPSLTAINEVEEWMKVISCYGGGYGSDYFIDYRYYNGEKCNLCGLNTKAYWKSVYKVQCNNTDDWGCLTIYLQLV